jgi:hypothetical protein
MRRAAYILIALAAASSALADENIPLLYTRTEIAIMRHHVPPLPWASDVPAAPAEAIFDTEIRDGATLYNQAGWYNLSGPSSSGAVLLVFGAPVLAPIAPSSNYVLLDILLLDAKGTVLQIFPKLRLSSLEEEIYPAQPVAAFLFLKGGTCETMSITPGDYVKYKLFHRPPDTLSAAPEKQ